MTKKLKTTGNTGRIQRGRPFPKGVSGNPAGKPKGARCFKSIFKDAAKEVAKDLKLGKEPDAVLKAIVRKGIQKGLEGDFNFYRDTLDRNLGKPKEEVDLNFRAKELKEIQDGVRAILEMKKDK